MRAAARRAGVDLPMSRFDDALQALGRTIQELREEQRMSRRIIAKRAGIRPRRLRAIETGRFDPPIEVVYALACELGIETHELIIRADAHAPHTYAPKPRGSDTCCRLQYRRAVQQAEWTSAARSAGYDTYEGKPSKRSPTPPTCTPHTYPASSEARGTSPGKS
jgi:transcriptional regulator with XRE-family HTH domain